MINKTNNAKKELIVSFACRRGKDKAIALLGKNIFDKSECLV